MNNFPDSKVAFVTGAAQGLGLGITQHLLSTGWKVMLFDLDADAGDEAITALPEEQQERTLFFKGDIANEHDVAIAVQQTVDRFGRIDGLVNKAGLPIRIRDRSNIWIGKAGSA